MNYERLIRSSRLATEAIGKTEFVADRSIHMTRPDRERLVGKVKQKHGAVSGGSSKAQSLVKQLGAKLKKKPPRIAMANAKAKVGAGFDRRQRAVVKIHYFSHAGGGGVALKAHAKYVARDAATARDGPPFDEMAPAESKQRGDTQAHADYLQRNGERGSFYDAAGASADGAARLETWAKSDLRHFRIILSAEEGARLKDLPAFTREVMSRAGASLGTKLSWIAIDHHDTDNPHTHIILRGRRANGQDLVLPRDFIKHGFRSLARDVATDWLGRRTPKQERTALERETRRHGPTRLDAMIEKQANVGRVKAADLDAPNGNAALKQALQARLGELERLGLAKRMTGGVFRMADGWRDQLKAMELHLDIRKRVVRERVERSLAQQQQVARQLRKGLLDR
ncbi:MAG: relaxase/mobilization nuclease domain-containing protein [Hyphomonadaceae bacterium]|nr:relaxase/mobilization nuclease domain-containing protein [Hyphomonadaceae bacterium]